MNTPFLRHFLLQQSVHHPVAGGLHFRLEGIGDNRHAVITVVLD
jgi:hypothetical protein